MKYLFLLICPIAALRLGQIKLNKPIELDSDKLNKPAELEPTLELEEENLGHQVSESVRKGHIEAMEITANWVSINKWYGQLGNNILQVSNAIEIAEADGLRVRLPSCPHYRGAPCVTKVFKLCVPGSNPHYIEVAKVNKTEHCGVSSGQGFPYFGRKGNACFTSPERHRVFQTYMTPFLADNTAHVDEGELVIHLRGGDKLGERDELGESKRQPSCNAYSKVIKEEHYTKVRIIHSDRARDMNNHPCWSQLKSLSIPGVTIKFQAKSLLEDYATLLQAQYFFPAYSTFSETAYWGSPANKVVYIMDGASDIEDSKSGTRLVRVGVHGADHKGRKHVTDHEYYNAPESEISLVSTHS